MTSHENIILKFGTSTAKAYKKGVLEIGKELVSHGLDKVVTGGFWIWDIVEGIEFYSPVFLKSLGFKGEEDFPSVPQSWQDQISKEGLEAAIDNYEKHLATGGEHPYHQVVEYTKKDGGKITVLCSGTIVKKNRVPVILVGSHTIL